MTLNIRYGFLTGNLFDGWSSDELASIDPAASVTRYAELCREAIEKAFPGAEVEIAYQHATGIVPAGIATSVYDPDQTDEQRREREVDVDNIGSKIYEEQTWTVSQSAA